VKVIDLILAFIFVSVSIYLMQYASALVLDELMGGCLYD
jgi:hypothetical protein